MRDRYRKTLLQQHSSKTMSGYIFASAGLGESSDEKYLPHADIVAGACIHEAERKSLENKGETVVVNYR